MRVIFGIFLLFTVGIASAASSQTSNGIWEREWSGLTSSQRQEAFSAIDLFERLEIDESQTLMDRQPLPWSDGGYLYRTAAAWEPTNLFFYFLRYPDGTFAWLDGTSPPIHAYNAAYPPTLNSSTIEPYVWFFGFFVRGNDGPFLIVESNEDTFIPKGLENIEGDWADAYNDPSEIPEPLNCRHRNSGEFEFSCSAILFYSNAIFRAELNVESGGMLQMADDEPLAADLAVKVFAPINEQEAGDRFEPKPSNARAFESLRSELNSTLFSTLEALASGETVRLDETNTPFLAGMASSMMESCGLPESRATRVKLAGFVASSSMGAIGGLDFSNPDIGAAIGSMGRQQGLLYSGMLVTSQLGCSAELSELGENIAKIVSANSAAGSVFVDSCSGNFSRQQCTCLANIGRQVIPDIAQRRYRSALLTEIIERNPLIALTISLSCGIVNY